ncbi:hypothetical protein ACFXPA_44015, partial [Amycolatopsis sp. NPDC059090]
MSKRAATISATSAAALPKSANTPSGDRTSAAPSPLGPGSAPVAPSPLTTATPGPALGPASAAAFLRGFTGCARPAAIAVAPAPVITAAAVHTARGPRAATYPPAARSFTVSPANNSSTDPAATGRPAPACPAGRASTEPG